MRKKLGFTGLEKWQKLQKNAKINRRGKTSGKTSRGETVYILYNIYTKGGLKKGLRKGYCFYIILAFSFKV